MLSPFFDFNTDFSHYGNQHIIGIILTFGFAIVLPILARRYFNPQLKIWVSRIIAIFISGWVILYILILIYLNKFNYKTDLPLDICNTMGLLLPFIMWNPNKRLFPYLYFYIMAGTTQAVFAPHLFNGFPNFLFIKFWVLHGGLIVYILYVAVIWDFQVGWKDLWRSFLWLQVFLIIIFLINKLIDANYVYIIEKPPTASVLDYLGTWPYYILVGEAILLLLSVMVYLPYINSKKIAN